MDHIQNLLLQTGWSCEDLIAKLAEFKQQNESQLKVGTQPNNGEKQLRIVDEEKLSTNENCVHEKKFNNANENNVNNKENDVVEKSPKNNVLITVSLKEKKQRPRILSQELSDHTYTLNVKKSKRKIDTKLLSLRKRHLRMISALRRKYFLFKLRKLRWRRRLGKLVNRPDLIPRYKSTEVIRWRILQQLRLLRSSKKSNLSPTNEKRISEDRIVSRKRYSAEKRSDILADVIEEVQNVEIISDDILEQGRDVIIEGDVETLDKSKINESVTDTITNPVGEPGTSSVSKVRVENHTEIEENTSKISELSIPSNECSMDVSDVSIGTNEDVPEESSIKNIVIVAVHGGCDVIPDDISESMEDSNNDPNHMIKPTKTKDITKIKGWKNKRFDVVEDTSNAAFASSNLDGFLEAAALDISFKIPTLDSGPPTVDNIPRVPTPQCSPKEKEVDLVDLYRPRTLGQKKRIMKLKYDLKSKKTIQKPRTLAEKRRLLGNDIEKIKIAAINGGKNQLSFSYVLHRGKKLRVVTRVHNDNIIAYIKSTNNKPNYMYVPKKSRAVKDKPSIFQTTYSPTAPVLRYRPGPLCRKVNLQYDDENWKTILKKLPKVTLTVVPEYKKPLHPNIIGLLPEYGFEITPDRLQFALTAVKPKKTEATCFEFPVPYVNNQEEIVLRKQNSDVILPEVKCKIEEEISIEKTCKDIVDKILNYLEIKEISDDVIKNDVNTRFLTEDKIIESKKDSKPGGVSKRRRKQGNKTNYELKRLNVKVIEVNLEEKEEIKNCKKDFCRLGCICRSLATSFSLVSSHCGRPDCMFECTCNFERKTKGNVKVTLPIGTDLLSEGAVNRLEDEAKKNLARVEKEFTQTVIQANNQTIVVGGCSNRQRRVTKLPKKYTDYIEDPEYLPMNLLRPTEDATEKYKVDNNCQVIKCSVNLTKLDLSNVIPFCLVHNLHDCHCGYDAEYVVKEQMELNNNVEVSDFEFVNFTEMDSLDVKRMDSNKINGDMPNSDQPIVIIRDKLKEEIYTQTRRPLSNMECCARTKGLPTDYYMVRNRTSRYITVRNRKFLKNMSKVGFPHDMQTEHEEPKPTSNSDDTDDAGTPSSDSTVTVAHEKSRRKQELVARVDRDMYIVETPENLFKVTDKQLKKQLKLLDSLPEKLNENKVGNKGKEKLIDKSVEKSPESKIIDKDAAIQKFKKMFPLARENVHYFQPSPDIVGQFVSMLGKKEDTTFCLLQWQTLATNYRLGKINIWFSSYFNVPRIVITDLSIVPRMFTNLKNFESDASIPLQKNEIVKALITDSVPGTNPKDEVQVILELTDVLCHVHGIIKKNQNKQENVLAVQKKTPKVIQTQSLFDKNESKEKGKKTRLPYPTVRKIMFSKLRCPEYTYVTVDKDNENVLPQSVTARLPAIKNTALWRMIKLNSDFSVLSLEMNEYKIKYSDLQKVLNMANDKNMTVAIKTDHGYSTRLHKDFSIYASPKCLNAVFVGPYYRSENHDITLMRYLNRELIPTKLFNKMRGFPPANVGIWLEQSKDASSAKRALHTIDLTESDQEESGSNREDDTLLVTSADLEKYENECDNYSASQNYYVELDIAKKLPSLEGNVYFSTNISCLGYILGHQLSGDAVLVRYPTYNTVLGFKNHAHAVSYLETEYKSSFIEAPGFDIKIIINNKEDNSGIVFNPELLKGYYIVSEIGLTNVLEVTCSKLKTFGMTELDLDLALRLRASRLVYDQCVEVAKSSLSVLTFKQRKCTVTLLKELQMEIDSLAFDDQRHKLEKAVVLQQKPVLLEHFADIFVQLAPYVNEKLKNTMAEVLVRNGKQVEVPKTRKRPKDVVPIDTNTSNTSNNDVKKVPSPKHAADVSLPIYTKNPDMIITATSTCKGSPENKIVKLSEKDARSSKRNVTEIKLKLVSNEQKNKTAETNPKPQKRLKVYKYIYKTPAGKIIEIAPEHYERISAQRKKVKASRPTTLMKTFQIGPVTVTPKLSKVTMEPLISKMPTAELKRISTTASLPPGFVKLTLKSQSQNNTVESNKSDVHR